MKRLFILLAVSLSVAISGCLGFLDNPTGGTINDTEENQTENETIDTANYNTIDGIGNVSALNMTIKSIEVGIHLPIGNMTEWTTVYNGSMRINLLDQANDIGTLFAAAGINEGNEIRLHIDDLTATVNNETYRIVVPDNKITITKP